MRPQQLLSMGDGGVMYVGRGGYRPGFNKKPPIGLPFEVSEGPPLFRGGSRFICLSGGIKYRWGARRHRLSAPPPRAPSLTHQSTPTPHIIHRLTNASLSPHNDLPPSDNPPLESDGQIWLTKLTNRSQDIDADTRDIIHSNSDRRICS